MSCLKLLAGVTFILTACLSPALSAASGELDTGFVTTIGAGLTPEGYPSFDMGTGATNAVALQSDGKILAGGNVSKFNDSGDLTALKRLLPSGALDTSFNSDGSGLGVPAGQPEVNALLVDSSNKIYVGGTFATYNGTDRSGILRLNSDGSLDTAYAPAGLSGTLRFAQALALQPDGKLLVGGGFTNINGTFRRHLARLNTDGTLDADFNPNTALDTAAVVSDIAVQPDGKILVAGARNLGAFQTGQLLVRLNADGSLDPSFVPALLASATGNVQRLLLLPDGRLVVSGFLSLAPSGSDGYLACLLPNGDLDTAFQTNLGSGPDGWTGGDLVLQPDGTILVAGIFTVWNDQPRASVARLNPDGTLEPTFAPAPYDERHGGYGTHFYSLAVQPDGKILAGGWFSRVTDPELETYNLTRFVNEFSASSPGSLRLISATATTAENAGSITLHVSRFGGLTGAVSVNYTTSTGGAAGTATANSDYTTTTGTLIWAAGEGGFKTITVPVLQDLTAESSETFTVTLSSPTGGATIPTAGTKTVVTLRDDDSAPAITRHPASVSLEQGASFTLSVAYDSVLAATVQWQRDPDGTGPLPFENVPAATTTSYTVANGDPTTHAGAYRAVVTSTAGANNSNTATVSISVPAGSVDLTTFTSTLTGGIVKAVRDSAGRYVVATSTSVYRITATGTVDGTFTTATASNAITDLLILDDGKILVAGYFDTINGTARKGLARLNTNGTLDTAFNLALTHHVRSLAFGAGGKLYVGGTGNASGLKRFTSAGVLDSTFGTSGVAPDIATNVNGAVHAVQELSDGRILVSHQTGFSLQYRFQLLSSSGTVDTSFTVPALNWNILTWDILPDGRIAIGGSFFTIGGQPAARLAILNTDGSLDSTFQVGTGPGGGWVTGVRYMQGRLLAWGEFTTVNGAAPRGLARFNLDGSLDASFSVGAGASTSVYSLITTPAGDFDIFGTFTSFKGVPRSYAARLVGNPHIGAIGFATPRVTVVENSDVVTLTLRRYGPTTDAVSINYTTDDGTAMEGTDYVGTSGTVTWSAGDAADKQIAISLVNDTDIESSKAFRVLLTTPSGPANAAASATVTILDDDTPVTFTAQPTGPGSSLFSGGSLSLTGATVTSPTPVTYQWLLNGVAIPGATSVTYTKNPISADDAGVYTLVVTNSAGSFSSSIIHVVVAPQPGRIAPGQAATGRPSFFGSPVQSILPLPDGGALIGGGFSQNTGYNVPQSHLLRVKADGSTDTSFTPSFDSWVRALVAQPDGKILVVGDFTFVNSATQRYLYRFNADLTPDTAFNSAVATAVPAFSWGAPYDVALDSTGRIYLGFSNGSTGSVWRFSSAGVVDDAYTLSTSTISFGGGGVTALAMQADDKLLVAGYFTRLKRFSDPANTDKNRLARVNTDGSIDTGFTASLGTLPINDLLVTPTGRIFVAGGTGSGTNLVEVSATDGTTLTGGSSGRLLYEIAFGPDGRLALARASSSGSGSISRLNIPAGSATSNDTTFDVGNGPNTDVTAVAYTTDGSLWIAGNFTTFNNFNSGSVVKLQSSAGDPGIVNQPARTDVNASATAHFAVGAVGTNLTYQWFRDDEPLTNDARITGATSSVLRIDDVTTDDDADYTVVVTGGTPEADVISTTAHLHVLGAPVILSSPVSTTPAIGSTTTLSADVLAASPATFAWKRNGVLISNGGRYSGATTGTLVITGTNSSDNGTYTLTVTNTLGSAATTPATVTVSQVATARDLTTAALGAYTANDSGTYVRTFLHLPDGRTLIGGSGNFRDSDNVIVAGKLLVVDATGNLTTAPTAFNGDVYALHRQSDGKILVAGSFTTVDSVSGAGRTRLARLNADLTLDPTFLPVGPTSNAVALHIDSESRIYVGGSFFSYDGQTGHNHLVRLLPNGSHDTTFKPELNSAVTSLVAQSDGKFIVGGSFSTYGPFGSTTAVKGVIRFTANGSIDTGFTAVFPDTYVQVASLAIDTQDRLTVSTSSNPYRIVRLTSNGAVDTGFSFTETLNNQVHTLAALPDGKILVGGAFSSPTNRFFRLNTNGTRDTGFDVGTGITTTSGSPIVYSIVPSFDGRIWIGGQRFTSYNGVAANAIAVLQGESGPVLAFTTHPTGGVLDLGSTVKFSAAATGNNGFTYRWKKNGVPLSNGARISGATSSTLTIADLRSSDTASYTVTITSQALSLTSKPASLAVLAAPEIITHPDASTQALGGTVTFTGDARGAGTLSYQWFHGSTALVNGDGISGATSKTLTLTDLTFGRAGHYTLRATNSLGHDDSTSALLTIERRPGDVVSGLTLPSFNGTVYAIKVLSDGSCLVGGEFTQATVNGTPHSRQKLARVLANGTLDSTFAPSFIGGSVYAIEVDSSGRIFVGGDFTSVKIGATTTPRVRVARFTSARALDTAFNTGTSGPNSTVYALAPLGDGSVYIGGAFNAIGTLTTGTNNVAKLNATGAADTTFKSRAGHYNVVYSLVRRDDGKLYIGGSLTSWNSVDVPQVVLVSSTGTRDTTFAPATSAGLQIRSMLLLEDGDLLTGGDIHGWYPYLKKLHPSTGAERSFPLFPSHGVMALAEQADGKLLAGHLGGLSRRSSDGADDSTFVIGTGTYGYAIRAVAVDASNRIYIGGDFDWFNDVQAGGFAILNGGSLKTATDPSGALEAQTITFASLANRPFRATPITLTASASSGLPVTFSVVDGPASISGSTLTLTGLGEVTVRASQAGNGTYAAALSVERTFTVTKASQTITFAAIPTKTLPSAPFDVSATASSGLPVTVTVLSGAATILDGTVTLTGTGTVTLRASQAGDASYAAAPDVDISFTVAELPTITRQPASLFKVVGASASFNVDASGTPTPTYQWKLNGKNIKGATSATYTITKTVSTHAGDYTVVVKNAGGSVTSSVAKLTFGTKPRITKQPAATSVVSGKSVTLSVTATGSSTLKYQWRFKGVNISGATKASYTISAASPSHAGDYSVVIKNNYGSVTSANAKLTVNLPPSITTQPKSRTVVVGSSVTFKVVATGTGKLTYQWRRNGVNISGATSATYQIAKTAKTHAGDYTVVVKNSYGTATSSKAKLVFGTKPKITNQPVAIKVKELGSATFTVTATGSPKVKYQWQRNGQNISGATQASYTIASVTRAQAGDYTVRVSNILGSTTSTIAKLTVSAVPAPESLSIGSLLAYTGTAIDSLEGTTDESRSLTIGSDNTFEGGTFTYTRTSATTATLTYEGATDETDYTETETAEVFLTFTSKTTGTYTSSGDYEGTHTIDGAYEGTFTGSGTFTLTP